MLTFALLQVFFVAVLVAANAFFVAAEFALVSVRDTRIQQLAEAGRIGARAVQRLHRNLDQLLAAVQFGVTLASLGLGVVGEPTFARMLERLFHGVPLPPFYLHVASIAIGFTLVSFVHVVLGEIVPKTLALNRGERVAVAVAGPMEFFIRVASPALFVMSRSATLVLRLFGMQQAREGGVHSPEELKLIVTASRRVGLLPDVQEDMIHRVLELENVTVREIMVPRARIFSLPDNLPLEEAMRRVVEEQHSRVPIYDAALGPEHIIGLLYSKDVSRHMHFKLTHSGSVAANLQLTARNIMRDILVVPETKPVSDLLQEFRRRKRHLAVVVDEFGSTVGMVTVEDALEQIVGELEDEFDVTDTSALLIPGGPAVVEGGVSILDLATRHHLELPRDEGFETLAGFILARLGRIPHGGEVIEHEDHRFTVVSMDGYRISKVKIEAVPQPEAAEDMPQKAN